MRLRRQRPPPLLLRQHARNWALFTAFYELHTRSPPAPNGLARPGPPGLYQWSGRHQRPRAGAGSLSRSSEYAERAEFIARGDFRIPMGVRAFPSKPNLNRPYGFALRAKPGHSPGARKVQPA